MYKQARDSIKSFDRTVKVGACGALPSTTLGFSTTYRESFFDYLNANHSDLDFYSWHIYGIKNPYFLWILADSIRSIMDDKGFQHAESHITEINDNLESGLQEFMDSPKGAVYQTAMLIMAQKSSIDKLFWYQGPGFFTNDQSSPKTWAAYGYQAFHQLLKETPCLIEGLGDILTDSDMKVDTTHLSFLSAASHDGNKLGLLIANYNTEIDSYEILIKNLPLKFKNDPHIEFYEIKNPDKKLTLSANPPVLNDSILCVPNQSAPSAALIFITARETAVSEKTPFKQKIQLTPNPYKNQIQLVGNQKINRIDIFSITGKKIFTIQSPNLKTIALPEHPQGIYLIKGSYNGKKIFIQKMTHLY